MILSPFSAVAGTIVGMVWIRTLGAFAPVAEPVLVGAVVKSEEFADCTATVEIFCPKEFVITTGTCIATRTVLDTR